MNKQKAKISLVDRTRSAAQGDTFEVLGEMFCNVYYGAGKKAKHYGYVYVGRWLFHEDDLKSFGYSPANGRVIHVLAKKVHGNRVCVVQRCEQDLRVLSDMRTKPEWRKMPWLAPAIDAIYVERDRITKETGIPHEVDHIHPVQSKLLCGLTVPWNLQIISATANRRKGNKLA